MVSGLSEDVLVSTKADLGEGDAVDSASYCYWRKANGWIVKSGAWPINYIKKSRLGWTPLDREYGLFPDKMKGWEPRKDPFRLILERGGAHEFPVDQLLELGWHRDPPRVNGRVVQFPQLVSVETEDVQCAYCRRWFLTSVHLHKHQSVMHREIAQNEQLARVLGENARAVTQGTATSMGNAVQLLGQLVQQLVKRQEDQETRQLQQDQRLADILERLTGGPAIPTAPASPANLVENKPAPGERERPKREPLRAPSA